jgi:chromosome segregation ATPase
MSEEQSSSPTGTPEEVDRIRNIIFGAQMRDYDQRFQTIRRDLGRLQQALTRLSDQLSEQDQDQGKKLQALRGEMRQADDDLRQELREAADQLMGDKMDRAALGDMFIELGQRLKSGGSLADLLGQLTEGEG